MPEYRHTQILQKTDEAQQVPFPERCDHNIVKDAFTQKQVQMIQKMPREIHSKVQKHVDAWFQRNSSAIVKSNVADLEQTTDEFVQSPGLVLQTSSLRWESGKEQESSTQSIQ